MSQHDLVIADQLTPDFRSDLNDALQALGSLSAGASEPATTYANMLWYDTSSNILKMRTEADDAWIDIGTLNQSTNTFEVSNLTELTQTQAEDDTSTDFGTVSGERLAQAVAANISLPDPGTRTLLEVQRPTSGSSVDLTTFDNTVYDEYIIEIYGLKPGGDDVVLARFSSDGGTTFDSGSSDYAYVSTGRSTGDNLRGSQSDNSGSISLGTDPIDSGSNSVGLNLTLTCSQFHNGSSHSALGGSGYQSYSGGGADFAAITGCSGIRLSNSEINAVRFENNAGESFVSGSIYLYGVNKS